MFKHLLIATDGTPLSRHAVEQGIALAQSLGARTTLLHVEPEYSAAVCRPGVRGETHEEFLARCSAHAESVLGGFREAARQAGVACATRFAIDDRPHSAIVHAAEENGCDLIVMASRVRCDEPGCSTHSQTQKVMVESGVPLLVFR